MRNLKSLRHSVARFTEPNLPLSATTWDASTDSLICGFGPTEREATIELRRIPNNVLPGNESGQTVASWEAPCPNPHLKCDKILSLQYFPESLEACLVLKGGDIVVVREEPLQGEESIEIVGSIDSGIAAARWSPEGDLLAVITTANTLLYMTRQFENSVNVSFSPEDVKVSSHVSVGWGKAETQFKGKRAKALRDPTVPDHIDEGLLSELDDGQTHISWRGDGAFLAINCIENGKRRMLRIYSRDGVLESVSEPVDHLEGLVAWRPAGNIIACIQRSADTTRVVFFERNGLRHGEFDLRLDLGQQASAATSLEWSIDSSVLAVGFRDKVQLWTMKNYHYYLKQQISIIKETGRDIEATYSKPISLACWHPEKPLRLAIHNSDQLQVAEYVFQVCVSSTHSLKDLGAAAVIDGKILKLTSLRQALVPPPMAFHELELPGEAQSVAFDASGERFTVLMQNIVMLYHYDWKTEPQPLKTWQFSDLQGIDIVVRQVILSKESIPMILVHDYAEHCDRVLSPDQNGWLNHPQESSIVNLVSSVPSSDVLAHTRDGLLVPITREESNERLSMKIPVAVVQIEAVSHDSKLLAFGITSGGVLYMNDQILVRNCTSMAISTAHLVFTTNQHLLKFVHLSSTEELKIPPDTPETDERCRSIERGARLVTVIPSTYSVILQMPRGNLETIYPRALVLASIRQHIEGGQWREAFVACRNQRVDMNIIHDQNPELFIRSIPEFVQQLKKAEYIDLFLSSLREEDVSRTMYRDTLETRRKDIDGTATNETTSATALEATDNATSSPEQDALQKLSKVNKICDHFLSYFSTRSNPKPKVLRNVITAHVCKQPPDLEAGLMVIAALQKNNSSTDLAEHTAEHICFLADPNKLYSAALGLYDINLTLLMAQQSQKDPREYLPYLQSLLEQPDLRRKFTIDNDLGRKSKALSHLYATGPSGFEELKQYVHRHELYEDAVALYRYEEEQRNVITRLYADFLVQKSRFAEAALTYDHLEVYQLAAEAYRQAGMWSESLSSAMLADISDESPSKLQALAEDLAASCEETKNFASAAVIHYDYLNDPQAAIRLYCRAHKIAEAIRLVGLARHPEWLTSIVDPGMVEATSSMTEMLGEMREQIRNQIPRLRELRQKKAQDPLAFYDAGAGGTGDGVDIPDNISLAPTDASTTGGTFMTRYTGRSDGTLNTQTSRRTHKNRRREERKRARGKKGTVYEEEYLVNSVRRLIERANDINADVVSLVEGLIRRRMKERASNLERLMIDVVKACQELLPEVWNVETKGVREDQGERPTGGDGVLWDSMGSLSKQTEAPVVKPFKTLSFVCI